MALPMPHPPGKFPLGTATNMHLVRCVAASVIKCVARALRNFIVVGFAVLPESTFNFNKSLVRINALFDAMLADLPETRDMFTDQRQARVVRQ